MVTRSSAHPDRTRAQALPTAQPAPAAGRPRALLAGALLVSMLGPLAPFGSSSRACDWAPACTAANEQYELLSIPGSSGDAYFSWIDARSGYATEVFAQRLLSTGAPVAAPGWPVNGTGLSYYGCYRNSLALAPDGAGGLLAAWSLEFCDGASRVRLQRVRPDRSLVPGWPQDGVSVHDGTTRKSLPAVVSDAAGGAYVAWVDTTGTAADLVLAHILSSGTPDPAWPPNGWPVAASLRRGVRPVLVADGAGGVLIAWSVVAPGGTDLMVQHVLASGARAAGWPAAGLTLCAATGDAISPVATTDGAGGLMVAWLDGRTQPPRVYCARKTGTGVTPAGWASDGNPVSGPATGVASLVIEASGSGSVLIAWQETRTPSTGVDIFAQRLGSDGAISPGWPADGVAVTTAGGDQSTPALAGDGADGAYIGWADLRSSPVTGSDIFVQRLTFVGTPAAGWSLGGTLVTDAPDDQWSPRLTPDGVGGAFISWLDRRNRVTTGTDVWMGRVDPSGALTPQARGLKALHRDGQTFLTWDASPGTGWTHRIYRSNVPITTSAHLASATLLWTVGDSTALDRRLSSRYGATFGHVIDSAATALDPAQGLHVVTPVANGSSYYAVTSQCAGGAEDRGVFVGSNALVSPVLETVSAPRPVFQRRLLVSSVLTDIYTLWSSATDTPDFPAMSSWPGMAFDCAVTRGQGPFPGPLMVHPHARGGSFLAAVRVSDLPEEWVLALDDPLPNGENTFWFGYHPDYDILGNKNTPPTTGVVVDYTFRRVRYTLDWAMRNFPLDPARVYSFGFSMGGIGAAQLALWLPGRIAAALTFVPKYDFSFLDDPDPTSWFNTGRPMRLTTDRMWGTVASDLPTSDGVPTYSRLDLGACASAAGSQTVPPIIATMGKRDNVVGWAEKTVFFERLRTERRGGIFFWSPEDHYNAAAGYWGPVVNARYLYRFRNDRSFPTISDCSLDDDPGDGHFSSGDSIGTINGFVEWDTTLTDLPDLWRVTLRLRNLSTKTGTLLAPESCLVNVTPTRLQRFQTVMGQPLPYGVIRLSDKAIVQVGNVWPDTLGRVTIPQVRLSRSGIQLWLGQGADSLLDVPVSVPRRPLAIRVAEQPVRGRGVLLVRGEGAEPADVALFDVAGRLVWRARDGRSEPHAPERRVELPALAPGLYFARASRGAERSLARVVVLE